MDDPRLIKSIRIRNLLSFGPESEEVELRPLNVLIGPNGSGKSNFVDVINLVKSIPREIYTPLREKGGISEWIWKGKNKGDLAIINLQMPFIIRTSKRQILYNICFEILKESLHIEEEEIIRIDKNIKNTIYSYSGSGSANILIRKKSGSYSMKDRMMLTLSASKDFNDSESIISQYKSTISYPEITRIGKYFENIKIYNNLVSLNNLRIPQQTDFPSDFISENYGNFPLVINDLKDRRESRDVINKNMGLFNNSFNYISTKVIGGTIQVFIYEKGLNDPIPATRLSDGTLRYLCLLAILCHPSPPPLICIEEPEVGLHPDILPTIADLLIEASKRTQLIVTTHSDILVSALSEQPESILVCEHDEAGTHMRRLEAGKLKEWLKKYSLGELWLMGEIGGNRW